MNKTYLKVEHRIQLKTAFWHWWNLCEKFWASYIINAAINSSLLTSQELSISCLSDHFSWFSFFFLFCLLCNYFLANLSQSLLMNINLYRDIVISTQTQLFLNLYIIRKAAEGSALRQSTINRKKKDFDDGEFEGVSAKSGTETVKISWWVVALTLPARISHLMLLPFK